MNARDQIEPVESSDWGCEWHRGERDAVMLVGGQLLLCLECAEDLGYELSAWRYRKGDSAPEAREQPPRRRREPSSR